MIVICVHPDMAAVVAVSDGKFHVIGLEPAEMRALADDLRRRADEVEAGASDAADLLLAKVGGTA